MPREGSVLGTIGNTPLLELRNLDTGCCRLFVKLENQNPTGSIKDRIGLSMIEAAERDGHLRPGGDPPNTIIEATAGNTGLGLALVASQKGYRLLLVIPDKMAQEKILHLRALGAQIHLTRSDVGKGHPEHYQDLAARLARETPNSFYVNQFANPANPLAHEATTGPEIWAQTGQMLDAVNFLASGHVGKITAIRMHWYRNTPHGKAQWARPVYPDMTPENIAWNSFLGDAPRRDFDPHRFINWRFFEEYSGGNVYENLSHQLAFWYQALNLQIPQAATMTGGLYLWKDGRDVPDTMNVTFQQPEQMLVSWDSGLGNSQLGITEELLGSDGTVSRTPAGIRYVPQKVNRPEGVELAGKVVSFPTAHMQNFVECIRSPKEPNCPFELGYRVSIACRMALESFHQGRTVRWDPRTETIV